MTTFQFNVGTYPTLAVRSRNSREGVYAGVRSGGHFRVPREFRDLAPWLYPFSVSVKLLNRKQRKMLKISEGGM